LTLSDLADELLEIRRYVRTHPEYVREQITKPVTRSHGLKTPFADRFAQIVANIHVGLACIHHDPEVLRGYLYGAAQEIRALAAREERAE